MMSKMALQKHGSISCRWWVFFLAFSWGLAPAPARADAVLTNAADVLALSAAEAKSAIPVLVQGIVTTAEPSWKGRFFVQDASGGVFVENLASPQPVVGDVVEVSGVSHPGGYAPIITKPRWRKLGTAPLPEAKPVTIERLLSGTEDSQRVSISGIVRGVQAGRDRLEIQLVADGHRLRAFSPINPKLDPPSLVGATVRLKGTVAAGFNAPLRHFVTVTLFVPRLEDFILEESAPANPFEEPLVPLDSIAQYRKDRSPGNQVRVKGVVTYQRQGEDLFLQDATGGLQVKSRLNLAVSPGEVVEAVGFPAVDNFLPILEDAVFRKTGEPPVPLTPSLATVKGVQLGYHHADFISLEGRVIDRSIKRISSGTNQPSLRVTLVLQTTNFIFSVETATSQKDQFLASIPIGSLVEASGISLLESSDDGKIKSLRLLLPTAQNLVLLKEPSWLTPRHLLVSLGVVFFILLGAIGWTVLISKNNAILKSLVREKEAAQRELQQAHDLLEERVKERTAQLKVEMTVRKEAELQFRAVLTERTRMAQELHDTLEQTMTGIALQLDMVGSLFEKKPANALHHLKLARNLMKQSQLDVRTSVCGLRSRATEQFNLTNALITNGRQITAGTRIRFEVETSGQAESLTELVEENLMRIGQEAITNVVKHSGASLLKIDLRFSPQNVVLQIKDNGKGFAPETCAGPKDGHFGLLGITERTERMGGRAEISSVPNQGTTIRIEIPTPVPEPV
jgi:signal transduction histidine kinase